MWLFKLPLIILITPVLGPTSVITPLVEYYDQYDDPVTFVSPGGYMLITCKLSDNTCPADTFHVRTDIGRPGQLIGSMNCTDGTGKMRLNITETWRLGWYKCQMRGPIADGIFEVYDRLCGDQSVACLSNNDTCHEADQFCGITADIINIRNKRVSGLVKLCNNRGLLNCHGTYVMHNSQRFRYCPLGTPSFCDVVYNGEFSRTFVEIRGDQCEGYENVQLEYAGSNRPFNEYIPIYPDQLGDTLNYHCPNKSDIFNGTLAICSIRPANVKMEIYFDPGSVIRVPLEPVLIGNQSRVFKAMCKFQDNSGRVIVTLSHFLVTFGGNLVISVHRSNDQQTAGLQCRLDPAPMDSVTVSYIWIDQKTGNHFQGSILNISEDGTFVCHGRIVYNSCSPHRQFSHTMIAVITDPMTKNTLEQTISPVRINQNKTGLTVLAVITTVLATISLGLAWFAYRLYRFNKQLTARVYHDGDSESDTTNINMYERRG